MNQPARGSRVVFVGNIPFELTEEQLIDIFKEVGPVASFRLLFDRETGRPKGYGFCEFYDAETAASAVRNLNDYDIGGRQIRVDYAAMDPHLDQRHHKQQQQQPRSGPTPPQQLQQQQQPLAQQQQQQQQQMPPMMGQQTTNMPPKPSTGLSTSVDDISKVLASMTSQDLFTLMTHMKQMSFDRPDYTREFLGSNPQVAYALFQAMMMMNIVDPNILTRIVSSPTGGAMPSPIPHSSVQQQQPQQPQQQQPMQPPPMPPPPQQQPQQPPQQRHPQVPPQVPPQMPNMPLMGGIPGAAPTNAAGGDVKEQQKALLMQVLQLTDEQINALGPEHRDQIRQLKAQLMQQPR
ncbi:hypothetical protein BDA99DRAFT_529808 [Phascolomyces articulosus]|uniref:RRM domain-containing protein n=1 Tax=Phascolomyces articulosus TaxID=60185 RepID=A0AAD5P8G8_9FUNG|nr:hypothetical protein BDA99DRAFT_529808 [Phascolomyces articulosus]